MRKTARRKRNSFGDLIRGIFSIALIVIIGVLAWKFYPQLQNQKMGEFDRYNLVIAGPQTVLVSLNLKDKSLAIVRFPNDLYISDVVHGYGQYKISSVYSAGQLDKRGGETVAGTIKEYLGVPADGYFYSSRAFSDPQKYFLSLDFITSLDRIKFLAGVMGVRFDKIKTLNLEKYAGVLVLADGSNALSLESVEVDSIIKDFLVENKIQEENFRIEVVNTTKTAGLGARVVRLLTNIGLSVVNVETQDLASLQCEISATKNALKSLTISRIANIYHCKVISKDSEDRAAITVKLGQDYADWLTK